MRVIFPVILIVMMSGAAFAQVPDMAGAPDMGMEVPLTGVTDTPVTDAAVPNSVDVQVAESDSSETKLEKKQYWKYGTIMYSEKAISWIKEARKSFETGIPLEILLPTIFPPEGKPAVEQEEIVEESRPEVFLPDSGMIVSEPIVLPNEAPAFYLKSILYISEDNWSVWLNNNKITSEGQYDQIDVVDVTPEKVIITWKNTQLDHIFPKWKDVFFKFGDDRYVSNAKNIVIDFTTGDVSFVLRPNQTLVTKNMEIIEGKGVATPLSAVQAEEESLKNMSIANDPSAPPGASAPAPAVQEGVKPKAIDEVFSGEELSAESQHMEQYMNQLNMLKSILDSK